MVKPKWVLSVFCNYGTFTLKKSLGMYENKNKDVQKS